MSNKVWQVLANFKIVHQGNAAGNYVIKLKDIKVTNGGVVKKVIYQSQPGQSAQDLPNARWYDPLTGRFAQADSIVPGGVQGLDRYAYVRNSPLNFTDPSGHRACSGEEECKEMGITPFVRRTSS